METAESANLQSVSRQSVSGAGRCAVRLMSSASVLSGIELRELRTHFDSFDHRGNGTIDTTDLPRLLRELDFAYHDDVIFALMKQTPQLQSAPAVLTFIQFAAFVGVFYNAHDDVVRLIEAHSGDCDAALINAVTAAVTADNTGRIDATSVIGALRQQMRPQSSVRSADSLVASLQRTETVVATVCANAVSTLQSYRRDGGLRRAMIQPTLIGLGLQVTAEQVKSAVIRCGADTLSAIDAQQFVEKIFGAIVDAKTKTAETAEWIRYKLRAVFAAVCRYNDGLLDAQTFASVSRRLFVGLSDDDVSAMTALADDDDDGIVHVNEFLQHLTTDDTDAYRLLRRRLVRDQLPPPIAAVALMNAAADVVIAPSLLAQIQAQSQAQRASGRNAAAVARETSLYIVTLLGCRAPPLITDVYDRRLRLCIMSGGVPATNVYTAALVGNDSGGVSASTKWSLSSGAAELVFRLDRRLVADAVMLMELTADAVAENKVPSADPIEVAFAHSAFVLPTALTSQIRRTLVGGAIISPVANKVDVARYNAINTQSRLKAIFAGADDCTITFNVKVADAKDRRASRFALLPENTIAPVNVAHLFAADSETADGAAHILPQVLAESDMTMADALRTEWAAVGTSNADTSWPRLTSCAAAALSAVGHTAPVHSVEPERRSALFGRLLTDMRSIAGGGAAVRAAMFESFTTATAE